MQRIEELELNQPSPFEEALLQLRKSLQQQIDNEQGSVNVFYRAGDYQSSAVLRNLHKELRQFIADHNDPSEQSLIEAFQKIIEKIEHLILMGQPIDSLTVHGYYKTTCNLIQKDLEERGFDFSPIPLGYPTQLVTEDVLLDRILSRLGLRDTSKLAAVSQYFNTAATQFRIWRNKYIQYFGKPLEGFQTHQQKSIRKIFTFVYLGKIQGYNHHQRRVYHAIQENDSEQLLKVLQPTRFEDFGLSNLDSATTLEDLPLLELAKNKDHVKSMLAIELCIAFGLLSPTHTQFILLLNLFLQNTYIQKQDIQRLIRFCIHRGLFDTVKNLIVFHAQLASTSSPLDSIEILHQCIKSYLVTPEILRFLIAQYNYNLEDVKDIFPILIDKNHKTAVLNEFKYYFDQLDQSELWDLLQKSIRSKAKGLTEFIAQHYPHTLSMHTRDHKTALMCYLNTSYHLHKSTLKLLTRSRNDLIEQVDNNGNNAFLYALKHYHERNMQNQSKLSYIFEAAEDYFMAPAHIYIEPIIGPNITLTFDRCFDPSLQEDMPELHKLHDAAKELAQHCLEHTQYQQLLDLHKLVIILNDPNTGFEYKSHIIDTFKNRYCPETQAYSKSFRLCVAVVVAATTAVACAVVGAIIGAAAFAGTGPGMALGLFIGLLKGASFGWAQGVVVGATLTGVALSGATYYRLGLFKQQNTPQTKSEDFVECAKELMKYEQAKL